MIKCDIIIQLDDQHHLPIHAHTTHSDQISFKISWNGVAKPHSRKPIATMHGQPSFQILIEWITGFSRIKPQLQSEALKNGTQKILTTNSIHVEIFFDAS